MALGVWIRAAGGRRTAWVVLAEELVPPRGTAPIRSFVAAWPTEVGARGHPVSPGYTHHFRGVVLDSANGDLSVACDRRAGDRYSVEEVIGDLARRM